MAEENKDNQPQQNEGAPLSRLNTYQDAVKEALRAQSMSSAGMLIAEQKKRDNFRNEDFNRSIKNPRNLILTIVAAILILGSLGIFGFSILKGDNKQGTDSQRILQSKYFDAEQMIELESAQLSRNTLSKIQQALNETYTANEIAQIVVTKEVKADENSVFDFKKKVPYETSDMLALIEARAPENLRRSLDQEFMLGVHKSSKNEPFLLFRATNFENVFAGMFEWEGVLAKDMANLFPREISMAKNITPTPSVVAAQETSTTSSSTIPEAPQKTIDNTRVWGDKVIRNADARVLLDGSKNVVFFYAFIDNQYLFFGTSAETFDEVRRRVRSAKLVL